MTGVTHSRALGDDAPPGFLLQEAPTRRGLGRDQPFEHSSHGLLASSHATGTTGLEDGSKSHQQRREMAARHAGLLQERTVYIAGLRRQKIRRKDRDLWEKRVRELTHALLRIEEAWTK